MLSKSYRVAVSTIALLCASLSHAADDGASPYSFEGQYRLDYWTGLSGPLKSRLGHSGLLDVRLSVDGEKAWAWAGGRIFVQAQATHGNHPNRRQSAVQGIDNAEVAVNAARIFQAWVEQSLLDDRVSILFGLFDLNSEFDITESSATLIHPSFGISSEIGQTGRNGPSIFPVTSLAVRGAWKVNDQITWRTALFDAVPGDPAQPHGTHIKLGQGDGTLLISELGYAHKAGENDVNKLAFGAWRYSSRFNDHVDTGSAGDPLKRKNHGAYVLGERTLWNANEDGSRGVDAFLRLGWAAGSVNQMDKALGAGVMWRGPFASRPKDKLTIGVAAEHNSHKWREARRAAGEADPAAEVAYELSYRALVNDWLSVQPDVQWVRNHGNQSPNSDALLVGVRLDFSF
ncbi:MAG: carbohydrate porin [Hydrogenophilales bacterium]|nr:carbohydrate porin [Hydrogenophilales bacterium]